MKQNARWIITLLRQAGIDLSDQKRAINHIAKYRGVSTPRGNGRIKREVGELVAKVENKINITALKKITRENRLKKEKLSLETKATKAAREALEKCLTTLGFIKTKFEPAIEKFLKTKPSDKLIQACVTDLCNGKREEEVLKETLSLYESLSKARIEDRFISTFRSLSSASKSNQKYSMAQLIEAVMVPLARIENLNEQLLNKVTDDLVHIINKYREDESKLIECVKAAQDIAGHQPTANIRNTYRDVLGAVCTAHPSELQLAQLNPNKFFERLSNLSMPYDIEIGLGEQIQFTGTQFGARPNFIKEYLIPVATSVMDFNDRLAQLPPELRDQTVTHYNELVHVTEDSDIALHDLNHLFARGVRADSTTEELDILDSLYRSSLNSDKKGLAELMAYRGESALELKRSYRDLVFKAITKDLDLAKMMISKLDSCVSASNPNLNRLLPMLRCFNALIDSNYFHKETIYVLSEMFLDFVNKAYYPSELAYNKYLSAIRTKGSNASQLNHQLELITAHDILMHNISNTVQEPSWEYFTKLFRNGDPPFRKGTPEYDQCLRESQTILRASFNAHYGFGALANDAKGGRNSILARFGRDVGLREVQSPFCKEANAFPGNGYVINGLNDDFLRIPDPARRTNGDEAYQEFLANYPFLTSVADDIDSTQFIFLRGMLIVTNLKDKYHLPDCDYERIPYSLVIYNDHFHNNGYDIAFLVPSKILLDKIRPTLFSTYDTDMPDEVPKNINDIQLDIETLRREAHAMNASIVNLGWSSNIEGLCSAWEPNRKPYWEWEANRGSDWRNIDGHKHLWFAMRDHQYWTEENEQEMRPFQRVHKEVYNVGKSLFDNLNSFKLFFSAYKHGYLGNFDAKKNVRPGDESTRTFANSGKFQTSSDNDIMLDQAYLLRQAALKRQAINFPKLVAYDTYRWSSEPIEGFELDLANMRLTLDGQTHQLNMEKPTVANRLLWRKAFSKFADLNYDFRFYEKGLNQH